jgi:hypothetical protein
MRFLTGLARASLIGVSLLIFLPLVIALAVDIANRKLQLTTWPPSGSTVWALVLVFCLPIHTLAAFRRRHEAFPVAAVLSVITANLALIGTDAGTFFCPTSLAALVVIFFGSREGVRNQ